MFSKTDLAKFLNLWDGNPDIVSKGAQKNFVHFAERIGAEWDRSPDSFNEKYFKHLVAKAIIFRHVEKLVTAQDWYEGGYRANVVAYTIAKLANDVSAKRMCVDFDRIWIDQRVSRKLDAALVVGAKAVHDVIIDPDPGIKNVTEWAKKQACWDRVKRQKVDWPADLWSELITKEEKRVQARSAIKEQKMLNGIEAQMAVVKAGAPVWRDILKWGRENKILSEKEAGILEVATRMDDRRNPSLPSEKQSAVIIQTLHRLRQEGCPLGEDIG
jgi:hypothetical protein